MIEVIYVRSSGIASVVADDAGVVTLTTTSTTSNLTRGEAEVLAEWLTEAAALARQAVARKRRAEARVPRAGGLA